MIYEGIKLAEGTFATGATNLSTSIPASPNLRAA